MTAVGSFTPTYDSNGNVTNDSLHTYSWDANGKAINVDGVSLTYDAFDRMVEQNRSGAYTQIAYGPTGQKLAIMSGATLSFGYVPLTAGVVAEYHGGGGFYYRHPDWLGNARLVSTTSQTMFSDTAYAPFGEPYAQGGSPDWAFTGMNQDTASGLYDFLFREYSMQGRWPSPDPAGLAAVDPTDPQSWNRYAYVENDPVDWLDPSGLCPGQPGCPARTIGPGCTDPTARANGSCAPMPAAACDDLPCGGWQNWYDWLAIQATPTGQVPNPDYWNNQACRLGDCPNVPPYLNVYRNTIALSGGGGTLVQPQIRNGDGQVCTPSVFNPSCKPPSCPAVFYHAAVEADLGLPPNADQAAKATARGGCHQSRCKSWSRKASRLLVRAQGPPIWRHRRGRSVVGCSPLPGNSRIDEGNTGVARGNLHDDLEQALTWYTH